MDPNVSVPIATTAVVQNHSRIMFVPTIFAVLLALGAVMVYRRGETKSSLESNEPPLLKSRIPFIGHLIGMLRWQMGYMQMLRYIGPWPQNRGSASQTISHKC